MNDEERIIRSLAASNPCVEVAGRSFWEPKTVRCVVCIATDKPEQFQHQQSCAWVAALLWVAKQPGQIVVPVAES